MSEDVIDRRGARGLLIAGTAEQAVAHYRGLIAAGMQYFTINLGDTADRETLRRLATDVIPHLRA